MRRAAAIASVLFPLLCKLLLCCMNVYTLRRLLGKRCLVQHATLSAFDRCNGMAASSHKDFDCNSRSRICLMYALRSACSISFPLSQRLL